jgi:hypothetical protein
MKFFKILIITVFLSLSFAKSAEADTQVVYFPTNVEGTQYLTLSVKKFITSLIQNRCPLAYLRAEKIIVTDISYDAMEYDLNDLVDDAGNFTCDLECEQFISTKFKVNYKKELKLDNDEIRMTLAETFLAEEKPDSSLLSLISLDSSGAVCR